MKYLELCPKCNAKLKETSDGRIKYCEICRYWTKIGDVTRYDQFAYIFRLLSCQKYCTTLKNIWG